MELVPLVSLVLLVALSAFFSGAETALIGSSRVRLIHLSNAGNKGAARALRLLEKPSEMLGTILVGCNLVNVMAAALATTIMGPVYATAVITVVLLIFAESCPKTLAASRAEAMAVLVAGPVAVLNVVMKPAVFAVTAVTNLLLRPLLGKRPGRRRRFSRQELITAIKLGGHEGELEPSETRMTAEVLALKDKPVKSLMIPLEEVEAIAESADHKEVLAEFFRTGCTRYPVYRGAKSEMVGLLLVKDLLASPESGPNWQKLVRPLMRCRADLPADELLRDMQIQRSHLAAVQDEQDRVIGIVTMEDVLEEIVGEIHDEWDEEHEMIRELSADRIIVRGEAEVDDLCKVLNIDLGQRDQHMTLNEWFRLRNTTGEGKLRRVRLANAQVVRRARNRYEIWVKSEAEAPSGS